VCLSRDNGGFIARLLVGVPQESGGARDLEHLTPEVTLDELGRVRGREEETAAVDGLGSARVGGRASQRVLWVHWSGTASVQRVDTRQQALLPVQAGGTGKDVGVACQVAFNKLGLVGDGKIDLSTRDGSSAAWVGADGRGLSDWASCDDGGPVRSGCDLSGRPACREGGVEHLSRGTLDDVHSVVDVTLQELCVVSGMGEVHLVGGVVLAW